MSDIDWDSVKRRFWNFVLIDDGCWLWTGNRTAQGYGLISARHTTIGAHRVAVIIQGRTIPDGYQIDHLCKNPSCVRFDHLDIVTPRVNTLRSSGPSALNAAKERCDRGHEFTRTEREGRARVCVECKTLRQRERRAAAREANPPAGPGSHQRARVACPAGHPYDDANTYLARRPGGGVSRMCRACTRARGDVILKVRVPCPDCSKPISRRNLATHRRRSHGWRPETTSVPVAEPNDLGRLPLAGA